MQQWTSELEVELQRLAALKAKLGDENRQRVVAVVSILFRTGVEGAFDTVDTVADRMIKHATEVRDVLAKFDPPGHEAPEMFDISGYMKHDGRGCPEELRSGRYIEIRMRDGDREKGFSEKFRWEWGNGAASDADIVGYRVLP